MSRLTGCVGNVFALEIFTPNLVKAYEALLDASNKTEWDSDSRQRKFIKPKKEIEVEL